MTGVSQRVGPMEDGQVIVCGLDNIEKMSLPVVAEAD